MDGWEWVVPISAVLGAALAYIGALQGTRQRKDQAQQEDDRGRVEEWGRRFTAALEAMTSTDERAQLLGRSVLAELARSHLATAEERELADRILSDEARFDPHGADLRLLPPGATLDDTQFIEDDGPTDIDPREGSGDDRTGQDNPS